MGAEKENSTTVPLLKWKIAKFSKVAPMDSLLEQIQTGLSKFNESLCQDLAMEEKILSFETAEVIFSKRELISLNRRVALLPRDSSLQVLIPWVISNLMDPTQIRTFILYYRFVMPFRFHQDIIGWLKAGLSEQLWLVARKHLETVSKAESSMQNP